MLGVENEFMKSGGRECKGGIEGVKRMGGPEGQFPATKCHNQTRMSSTRERQCRFIIFVS